MQAISKAIFLTASYRITVANNCVEPVIRLAAHVTNTNFNALQKM